MTSKRLTKTQALLLQRYVDEEASTQERRNVDALLSDSAPARVYVSALQELTQAVQWAEEQAWEEADVEDPAIWLELAEASSEFSEADLDDLAPLLERFFDAEVDAAEAAVVASLVDERDDVAQYLSELERLSQGVKSAGVADDIDFDGFFDEMSADLDAIDAERKVGPVEVGPFDLRRDLALLHRYHDNDVSAEERRRVQAWIESQDPEVDAALGALAEIHLGVTAAMEVVCEKVDFDEMQASIDESLDVVAAEQAADNVVSLAEASTTPGSDESGSLWNKPVVAIAAAVALLITGALIGPQLGQLGGQDEAASSEQQTIVIVDDVQSAPGSSVYLHSPELVGHDMSQGAEFEFPQAEEDFRVEGGQDDPTVLWIIDDEENGDDDERNPEDETDELPGPI